MLALDQYSILYRWTGPKVPLLPSMSSSKPLPPVEAEFPGWKKYKKTGLTIKSISYGASNIIWALGYDKLLYRSLNDGDDFASVSMPLSSQTIINSAQCGADSIVCIMDIEQRVYMAWTTGLQTPAWRLWKNFHAIGVACADEQHIWAWDTFMDIFYHDPSSSSSGKC